MENVNDDMCILTLSSVNSNLSVILFELKNIVQKLKDLFQAIEENKAGIKIFLDV